MKLIAFGAIRSIASPSRCSSFAPARRAKRVAALAALAAAALSPTLAANAAEHSLVGIRVFASVHDVLARFGNPNKIITDASQFSTTTTSTAGEQSGTGMGMMGGAPGMRSGAPAEFGAPGAPSMGGPSMGNPYAPPSSPGGSADSSSTTSSATSGEVMYVYNRPGGVTYDFLLSPDGRVIQITVLGYKSASVKTGRGLQLGTTYKTMIGRYGYPEAQTTSNTILTATYLNRDHASFQLRNNQVVGITVAAVE